MKFLCLLLLSAATLLPAAEKPKQPNILFIFSDDHSLQALTAYGNSRYAKHFQTPNIDRLAKEGALFVNSFRAPMNGSFSTWPRIPTNNAASTPVPPTRKFSGK